MKGVKVVKGRQILCQRLYKRENSGVGVLFGVLRRDRKRNRKRNRRRKKRMAKANIVGGFRAHREEPACSCFPVKPSRGMFGGVIVSQNVE